LHPLGARILWHNLDTPFPLQLRYHQISKFVRVLTGRQTKIADASYDLRAMYHVHADDRPAKLVAIFRRSDRIYIPFCLHFLLKCTNSRFIPRTHLNGQERVLVTLAAD